MLRFPILQYRTEHEASFSNPTEAATIGKCTSGYIAQSSIHFGKAEAVRGIEFFLYLDVIFTANLIF